MSLIEEVGTGQGSTSRPHPIQVMVWLGLCFDIVNMTVSIPDNKPEEVCTLVEAGNTGEQQTFTNSEPY